MADAVGCVTKAVDLALKIKAAVDTVRQNRKDCTHIKRRVERVRHTLSLCEGNAELMESPAVRDAVEALAEVLSEALELVAGCQEETNAVCLYCTAGKLSKQLSKVDRGISDGNSEATFAILVYHISKQTGDSAGPAMSTEPGEITEPLVVEEVLEQAQESGVSPEQTQQGFFVGRRLTPKRAKPRPASAASNWPRQRRARPWPTSASPPNNCSSPTFQEPWRKQSACEHFSGGDGAAAVEDDSGDDGALLQDIARVTLAIRTAMETVHRNRDECVEIDKIASRANVLVSQLEGTETTKDKTVIVALKNLLRTFRYAHELIAACHRRSVLVLCSARKLSSELRGVQDEMMLGLDDLIEVLL